MTCCIWPNALLCLSFCCVVFGLLCLALCCVVFGLLPCCVCLSTVYPFQVLMINSSTSKKKNWKVGIWGGEFLWLTYWKRGQAFLIGGLALKWGVRPISFNYYRDFKKNLEGHGPPERIACLCPWSTGWPTSPNHDFYTRGVLEEGGGAKLRGG